MNNISASCTMIGPISGDQILETYITFEIKSDIFEREMIDEGERVVLVVVAVVCGGGQGGTAVVDPILAIDAYIGAPLLNGATSIAPGQA